MESNITTMLGDGHKGRLAQARFERRMAFDLAKRHGANKTHGAHE